MRSLRSISLLSIPALVLLLASAAVGQVSSFDENNFGSSPFDSGSEAMSLTIPLPHLSPDLALATFQRALKQQSSELAGYTANTIIEAELTDSAQKAEFELKQHYAAPGVLEFTPVHSSGDSFVKSNVIVRLLQSEVEHVQKHEQWKTAINSENYKFSYKGEEQLSGIAAHVYDVKPRHKRVGLFKGRIYVDAGDGNLLRAQGRIAKSPSFFIKRIDFVQDFATVDGFTFPVHLHSEAQTRIVGKAVVDLVLKDYRPEIATPDHPESSACTVAAATK
jgi:hypothetical protein